MISHVFIVFLLCVHVVPTLLSFFFNDTATTEIYTLSLHDALPISSSSDCAFENLARCAPLWLGQRMAAFVRHPKRSEEHTSELQSRGHLVCRLLLEKKKNKNNKI